MDQMRKHPHHIHSGSSHRNQLFTSFISLIIFLFLLIVVLSLSPHVHGSEDVSGDISHSIPEYAEVQSDAEISAADVAEDRIDKAFKKGMAKVPVPRVKRVMKAKTSKITEPAKSLKPSRYELMSPAEVRELHSLMGIAPTAGKKRRIPMNVNPGDEISRRLSGRDRRHHLPQPVSRQSYKSESCPWCNVAVVNAGVSGSESRIRATYARFPTDTAYSDSSVPPDQDDSDRQVRFVTPSGQEYWPHRSGILQRNPIESRSVPKTIQHHEDQTYRPLKEEPAYEQQREPEAKIVQQQPAEHVGMPALQYQQQDDERVPLGENSGEHSADNNEAELPMKAEYLKTTIEQERKVLKAKRLALKKKHPLLKHFPKFFAYLDRDEGLDRDPEEPETVVKKKPAGREPELASLPDHEPKHEQELEEEPFPQSDTAMLIPPTHAARAPVLPLEPPAPAPPMILDPPDMDDHYPLVDDIPAHHYTPQLSPRRPLLVPSIRLRMRLAMPIRAPGKVPTSLLNTIPEPDYKTFDPLPRKLGSKVVDRFYSSNIVQDIGLVYAPRDLLNVHYPSGAILCLGNPLSVLDSFSEPQLTWPPVRATTDIHHPANHPGRVYQPLYTVIMLDPDVPLMDGQYVHWLRVNVPSPGKKGTTIVKYINPLPIIPALGTIASPNHRYVFLVFAQTRVMDAPQVKEYVSERSSSFILRDFIKKFGLEPQPVAGNYFFGRMYVKTKIIC